jgi:hypothetical protein
VVDHHTRFVRYKDSLYFLDLEQAQNRQT